MCFSRPKQQTYAPPPVQAPPDQVAATPDDAKGDQARAVGQAQDDLQRRASLSAGRQSTILTGPFGTQGQARTRRTTLLGQG